MKFFPTAVLAGFIAPYIFATAATASMLDAPKLDRYQHLSLPAAYQQAHDRVRITFLGVSTVLFDDGETAIMTDGFFTRPGKAQIVFGKVSPNPKTIARALERAGVKKLSAVLVAHSHFDHVMDTPEVAKQTGALVVGSEATANVARGWGLGEDRIRVVNDGEKLNFGRFEITFVKSEHNPTPIARGDIKKPLVPPVQASKYEEGGSFSILVKNRDQSILVQSSAGFSENALRGHKADVALLGIGRIGMQKKSFRDQYWRETVQTVGAKRVIPIHWDDFSKSLDEPLQPAVWPLDAFNDSMEFVMAASKQDHVDVKFAPAWVKVDPFAGL